MFNANYRKLFAGTDVEFLETIRYIEGYIDRDFNSSDKELFDNRVSYYNIRLTTGFFTRVPRPEIDIIEDTKVLYFLHHLKYHNNSINEVVDFFLSVDADRAATKLISRMGQKGKKG